MSVGDVVCFLVTAKLVFLRSRRVGVHRDGFARPVVCVRGVGSLFILEPRLREAAPGQVLERSLMNEKRPTVCLAFRLASRSTCNRQASKQAVLCM